MKQKLYIAGLVNLFVILAGTAFKINHFPGAGIIFTIGIVSFVLVVIPLLLVNSYRNSENGNSALYILSGVTCFIMFTAMLFKIMHWPFASVALIAAIFFLNIVFLPVFVLVSGRDGTFSINSTVFVLLLLAVNSLFSALLSLNVAKTVITDSLTIPGTINAMKTSLVSMPQVNNQTGLIQKIDDALMVIDEYQAAILTSEGLTEDKWNKDPESLLRPDSRNAVQMALHQNSELQEGKKLRKAIGSLIETARLTPGYESLARAIPYFAGLTDPRTAKDIGDVYFTEDFLTWTLAYLDSLETNLRLLKATII
jgi:hypothetical protein